jgi:hypothetical protein
MKKSGLADSPFFKKPLTPPDQAEEQALAKKASLNVRSNVQAFKRSDVQMNERSSVQLGRRVIRHSYDIYQDQAEAIDELVVKQRRERGKYVTKGEVMRELLDEAFTRRK